MIGEIEIGSTWQWLRSLDGKYTARIVAYANGFVTLVDDYGRNRLHLETNAFLKTYVPILRTYYMR
jgi:hypothetical protein